MTERERKDALFNRTMTRLAHMGIEGDTVRDAHVLALAEEIEGYREKINSLDTHMEQVAADRNRLREEVEQLRKHLDQQTQAEYNRHHYPAEIENAALREAIVRRFLKEFGVDYIPGA